MEGDGPPEKRLKRNAKSLDEAPNGPNFGTASPVVKSSSFDQIKRKIPKPNVPQPPKPDEANVPIADNIVQAPEANPVADIIVPGGPHILNLNVYVLRDIFDHLNLSDLCSIAEVCVDFRELARDIFAVKHQNVSLTSLADVLGGSYTLLKVRQLLYNFGDLIKTLSIDYTRLNNLADYEKVMQLVGKYTFGHVEETTSLYGKTLMLRSSDRKWHYTTKSEWCFKDLTSSAIHYLERDPQ